MKPSLFRKVSMSGLLIIAFIMVTAGIFTFDTSALAQSATPVNIGIKDFKFTPDTITIPVGTKVIWTNQDTIAHTVTSDNGVFKSDLLNLDKSFEYTFNQPGTFSYHCDPHPFMIAKIVVQGTATGATTTTTNATTTTISAAATVAATMPPMTMSSTTAPATTTVVPTPIPATVPVTTTNTSPAIATSAPTHVPATVPGTPVAAAVAVTPAATSVSNATNTSASTGGSGILIAVVVLVILAAVAGGGVYAARSFRRK